jgi:peptidoglycan biosynthesis protein MviN/MurJ (putative lipid II flippase)
VSIRYYLCWFVLPIALTGCVSAYVTSLGCRFARKRHKKCPWRVAVFSALTAGLVTVLFIWLGLSLPPGEMIDVDPVEFYGTVFVWVTSFALAPALLVWWYYRRNLKDAEHMG